VCRPPSRKVCACHVGYEISYRSPHTVTHAPAVGGVCADPMQNSPSHRHSVTDWPKSVAHAPQIQPDRHGHTVETLGRPGEMPVAPAAIRQSSGRSFIVSGHNPANRLVLLEERVGDHIKADVSPAVCATPPKSAEFARLNI
jgi:hypothetical protein